jgi:hypothetical protein
MKTQPLLLLLSLAGIIAALTGCQSIDQPKGSSEGYSSFRFIERGSTADGRFEEPSEFRDRTTQSAILDQFGAHGISFEEKDADLLVAYLYIKQDNVSTMAAPTYYGEEYQDIQSYAHKKGVLKSNSRDTFEVGAIVIDVIDLKTQKLIYRSYAKRDIKGVTTNAERDSLIGSAVAEALSGFFE